MLVTSGKTPNACLIPFLPRSTPILHLHYFFSIEIKTEAIHHAHHIESIQVMTSREDQILKPRDPSVEDENEWEEFSLTDVKVLIPGKSRYANLLDASPDNPVRVVGSLNEVEDEQGHLGMTLISLVLDFM